jgi:tripartite-type tricarboxylate transporter receptor subunit TctC
MVSGDRRNPAFPDVPCAAESGLPDYTVTTWYGLWAPKGTPAAVVDRLAKAAQAALRKPEVIAQYRRMGAEPVGSSPAEFRRYMQAEEKKWAQIVRQSGARAD